ncbi:hypothetical protein [Malonomonas rubra]|uniref:hypothetical protein n=1 Tax=Malonomonas rubra TaxID=57040 RepID=UPI0026F1A6F0|nr:hypothetical protein [Malonomonas rubra]
MNKQNKILRNGFALFSLITSFAFVYYAVGVISGGNASEWLKTFAYVAGGYGLFNVYILSWAWRSQHSWAVPANMVIAACFFGVVVMDVLREGFQGTNQAIGLLGLAVVLAINWFAIKKLSQR